MPQSLEMLFPTRAAKSDRPLGNETVLVVEDSRFACEALRLICQRSGARIRRADCLRSARKHLATYRPTIAIVDIGLPDGSGETLIRELTAGASRSLVVIGTSGDEAQRERALAAGADAFLLKPIPSVAAFQSLVLSLIPRERRALAIVSDEPLQPDTIAVRDDLAQVAAALSRGEEAENLDYVAQFLRGVARDSGDGELESAAAELQRHRAERLPVGPAVTKVSTAVAERLARFDAFAA